MAGRSPVVELKDIFSYRNLVHAVAGATVSVVLAKISARSGERDVPVWIY